MTIRCFASFLAAQLLILSCADSGFSDIELARTTEQVADVVILRMHYKRDFGDRVSRYRYRYQYLVFKGDNRAKHLDLNNSMRIGGTNLGAILEAGGRVYVDGFDTHLKFTVVFAPHLAGDCYKAQVGVADKATLVFRLRRLEAFWHRFATFDEYSMREDGQSGDYTSIDERLSGCRIHINVEDV